MKFASKLIHGGPVHLCYTPVQALFFYKQITYILREWYCNFCSLLIFQSVRNKETNWMKTNKACF